MTVANEEEMSLHAYLLGELPLDEQMRLEERLLLDREYVELLLIVEEELIDDYLRGTLSDRDRAQFETHFLTTPDRRRKLRRAKVLRRYVNNAQSVAEQRPARDAMRRAPWWRAFLTPAWGAAVAALLILGVGLGIWRGFFSQSLADKGRASLQAAFRESPVEARIGSFNWSPRRVTLAPETDNVADKTSLESAERYLRAAVAMQPGPDSYHALGQFYLAKRDLDSAIEQFDRALEGDPKNAKLHNDLGVALMERARGSLRDDPDQSAQDSNRSVKHLNEARALDDSLLEALFNLALCHQYMLAPSEAEAEWRDYLKRDSGSQWADEARRHLKELEDKKQRDSQAKEALLQDFLSAYRTNQDNKAWEVLRGTREIINGRLIWWQLLDPLNSTAEQRAAEAKERLQALLYVGTLELQRADDHYVSELGGFYHGSPPAVRTRLADAHGEINKGNELLLDEDLNEAYICYGKAREILKSAGDVWEVLLTDYLMGLCHIQKGDIDQSLDIFSRLVTDCRNKGYQWLLGQSFYSLGMVLDRKAEHSEAKKNTEEALRISEKIQDLYNIQRSLTQIADQSKKMANYAEATTYVNRCLEQMRLWWPGKRQMWRNYDQLTQVLVATGLYSAAADYANEALRLALEEKDPRFIYVSYTHLAVLRGIQQDYTEALKLAQLGLETAPKSGDPRAYASLQMGHLHRQAGDFSQALYDYDQAIKYIDSVEESAGHKENSGTKKLQALRYDVHKGRLFCLFAGGGDPEAAEKELGTTLGLLEAHRTSILEEQNRNTFFDREQSVYDAAIDFQYSRKGDLKAVFDYSEKSRARSLLDLITTNSPGGDDLPPPSWRPQSMSEIQSRMPDKTQLVEYAALDDKLLICLVSKSDFSVTKVPVTLGDLTDKVKKFRKSILDPSPDRRVTPDLLARAQELYGLLIDPIKLSAEKGERVCFVADKVLNTLPFRALVSPSSNRYLAEDYQLTMEPSATIYVACCERKKHLSDTDHERLLAVGDASFDRSTFPSLSLLPSTREQVESIARLYSPGPPPLTGNSARKDLVKQGMENSDVIHIASHYKVDKGSAMKSGLLLAPEPGADGLAGLLQAGEVRGLNLYDRAPLVVLSACDSGVEHYYSGEGMIGMSCMFIAAGAPLVVASLWEVEVDATDNLMVNFHTYRKRQRMPSVSALTEAQRDMLSGRKGERYRHPYYWAGFTAIGAHTDF
ncbi:MAG: CHAT domain-containing protein [Blastocatellia bacterium]